MSKARGARIENPDSLLHRQVHPSFVHDGQPSSQAFRPTLKDGGLLSVSDGSKTTAELAYKLHVERRLLASKGVWSLIVSECTAANLPAFEDPEEGSVPDPAHAVVDFDGLSSSQVEARAKRLKSVAAARGCQYQPPT
ncbi:MAG: hypothetical protein ABI134_33200, partial [Byssovorax sp.]